ncbi:YetF domain-containing protein [Halalkalibacterium ligniniphilum]|uniref:YetF domain-containing protein n=1 Tax=Halalkalibacterium ligniniphilum TaxID=1134413 RepID=UPI00034C4E62|nr:DUF421 domain-containing protein [Halalkalibacterium ligniniphilum]
MMNEPLVVIVRAIITFFTILIYTRIIGKQQLGNLTMFDYINGITIGSIAATMATDISSTVLVHWLALTIFILLTLAFQIVDIKNRYLSKVIDSEPVVVMQNGKILESNLSKARITKAQLMMQLRGKNIFDPTEIEVALLEPNGTFSILPKSDYQAVKRKDLRLPMTPAKLTTEIIVDGIILEQNLKQRGKTREWLDLQLKARGIEDLKEVSYVAILPNDTLYVDKFEDHVGKENNISDYEGPY